MALTKRTYPSDGARTVYPIDFTLGYLQEADIYVHTGDPQTQLGYSWVDANNIELDSPHTGSDFFIQRIVERSELEVDYSAGAKLTADNLDTSNLQHLMITEELTDDQESIDSAAESAEQAAASEAAAAISASAAQDSADLAETTVNNGVIILNNTTASGVVNINDARDNALLLTGADVAATNADVIATTADAAATAQDVIATNIDAQQAATSGNLAIQSAQSALSSEQAAADSADSASSSAAMAQAASSYIGEWGDFGAVPATVPTSVSHNGQFWNLINDIGAISASEPSVSNDWLLTTVGVAPRAFAEYTQQGQLVGTTYGCSIRYPTDFFPGDDLYDILLDNPISPASDILVVLVFPRFQIHNYYANAVLEDAIQARVKILEHQKITRTITTGNTSVSASNYIADTPEGFNPANARSDVRLSSSLGTANCWWIDPVTKALTINAASNVDIDFEISYTEENTADVGKVQWMIYDKKDFELSTA